MSNIYIDTQPILKGKSGIGWYSYNIIKEILIQSDYKISGLAFDFNNRNQTKNKLVDLGFENALIHSIVPARVYKLLWKHMPVKYDKLFKGGDLYHYLNYILPPISKDKKTIINVYDMVYKLFPHTMKASNLYLLNRDLEKSMKRTDKIITISESAKSGILKFNDVPEDKISVVTPGLDYELYSNIKVDTQIKQDIMTKYGLPEKFFLYLGTIEPRKNIETIFKAYQILPDDVKKEYKLVICGGNGWHCQELLAMPKKLDIDDNVIYTGYVEEQDKPYIYTMAKIFLFPSLYEGFGMPVVEAMSCGTPVITSNTSSLPEAGGDGACYVEPKDYDAILNEIIKLLSNDDYLKSKVELGRQHANKFSWTESASKTIKIYKEILQG